MSIKPKRVKWFAILAVMATLVAACGSDSSDTEGGTIGLTYSQPAPFYTDLISGAEEAAAALGMTVNAVNVNVDPAAELKAIQNFITQEVDAIIIDALNEASVEAVKLANDAGIPVVCTNLCIGEADMKAFTEGYVTSDNTALGDMLGDQVQQYIDANLDGTAKVIMLECSQFAICRQRDAAFKARLGPNVTVVFEQDTLDVTAAPQVAQDALTANPDATIIAGMFVFGAQAGLAGVTLQGLEGEVAVFGIDLTPPLAEALLAPDNIMQVMIDQDGASQGAIAVGIIADVLAGNDPVADPYTRLSTAVIYSRSNPDLLKAYVASH